MIDRNRISRCVALLGLILLTLGLGWWCARNPRGNGDLGGYIQEMLLYERSPETLADYEILHRDIYAAVKAICTPEQYLEYTEATPNRRLLASDVTGPSRLMACGSHRKFGSRVLYNGTNYLLWKAGMELGRAPFFTSAICMAACLWPMYVLSGGGLLGLAACLFCSLAWSIHKVGVTASPDAMAAFLALMLLAYYRRPWSLVFIVLMPLARPNMILFSVLMVAIVRTRWWWRVLAIGLALLLYHSLNEYFGSPPWNEWFYRDLVVPMCRLRVPGPTDAIPDVPWRVYRAIVIARLPLLYRGDPAFGLCLVGPLAWLCLRRENWVQTVMPTLYFIGMYLIFPFVFLRFFVWVYVALTLVVVRQCRLTL